MPVDPEKVWVEAETARTGAVVLSLRDVKERRRLFGKFGQHNVVLPMTELQHFGFPPRYVDDLRVGRPVQFKMSYEGYVSLLTGRERLNGLGSFGSSDFGKVDPNLSPALEVYVRVPRDVVPRLQALVSQMLREDPEGFIQAVRNSVISQVEVLDAVARSFDGETMHQGVTLQPRVVFDIVYVFPTREGLNALRKKAEGMGLKTEEIDPLRGAEDLNGLEGLNGPSHRRSRYHKEFNPDPAGHQPARVLRFRSEPPSAPDLSEEAVVQDAPPLGSRTSAAFAGKHIGTFRSMPEAVAALHRVSEEQNYRPDLYYIDDHGGINLLNWEDYL